jgi:D-alanyl-D-alanine carboxypeptidase/D-alanyl-D-alanine-endopeptidase (penicillin-binding protein 4)
MPRLVAAVLCLAVPICAAQLPVPAPPIGAQVTDILSDPALSRGHWGIYVSTLDGQPIYAFNEGQLFQPASNAKLFTTAAALALLGPAHVVTTRVTGALDPATGTVHGDLTLVGAGDPNLDSQDLPYVPPAARPKPDILRPSPHLPNPMRDINDLVAQLAAKGVRQIDGDIVGDDTLFPWQPYPEDWTIDDAVWGYSAPVSALSIADNQLRLTITPSVSGQPASVTLEQAVPYYTVQNEARTVATRAEASGIQVARMPGSRTLRVFGSIFIRDQPDVEHVAIDDPTLYAAMVFRAALIDHGIAVIGTARASHRAVGEAVGSPDNVRRTPSERPGTANIITPCGTSQPASAPVLAAHVSAPLADDVIFTNKVSENLHAELLLDALSAAAPPCADRSRAQGARQMRGFLVHAGIDPSDFVFFDGSGLSGHDLVTPRATAKLLAFAATQPWFAVWKSSLPVGGEDGSLSARFSTSPLKGHVFAKTGTLSEARALSGYLEAGSGRTLIFSIMVGNHLPGSSADRDAVDKIVAAIQATQ